MAGRFVHFLNELSLEDRISIEVKDFLKEKLPKYDVFFYDHKLFDGNEVKGPRDLIVIFKENSKGHIKYNFK
jgi:hypothetical protein